jgi:hypothetical protein
MTVSLTNIERIRGTLDHFDPERRTILVGGAAIELALSSVGIHAIRELSDIDALCDSALFDQYANNPRSIKGAGKFQLRWPKGRLLERGATNLSIDIYPDDEHSAGGMLPLTLCTSMGDLFYPIDYSSCENDSEVQYCGERSMRVGEVLRWIALVGRQKDLRTVEQILPVCVEKGLIDTSEEKEIQAEYDKSYVAHNQHPERWYARLV